MSEPSPLSLYRERMRTLGTVLARLSRWDLAFSWARLGVVVTGVTALVFALKGRTGLAWSFAAAGVFLVLVVVHDLIVKRRDRMVSAIALCEAGVDRIEDRWVGKGDAGERFRAKAKEHLYAEDLDLYGRGGLFERLSVAHTPVGQATLARWLETPASAAVVRARQTAVAELAPMLVWRHEFALAADKVRDEVRDEALVAWAARAPVGMPVALGRWRVSLAMTGISTLITGILALAGRAPAALPLATFVVGATLAARLRKAVSQILTGLDRRADELGVLAGLMAKIEQQSFRSDALRALSSSLETEGLPASRRIARLRRLVQLVESRRNQLGALVMVAVQATPQLALAIETWRRLFGEAVIRWMKAVGEVEALSSLATLRFENPELPFPTIVASAGVAPSFEAEQLGHPLIPASRRVCNDLRLGDPQRLLLVSGSNMSGKSTLLRTVGVNAVLALCGAPVFARRLTMTPVSLGATLRINDSLQDGKSRFYAELVRLKQIVDRAGNTPQILFLLDEILHGTNSHDRRRGAEGLIRGLLQRGAIGLVTTHDLALAEVAAELGERAANVHFEDHLEGGKMTFDYRIKDGVVRKSNALALMRAVGLEI